MSIATTMNEFQSSCPSCGPLWPLLASEACKGGAVPSTRRPVTFNRGLFSVFQL